MTRTPFLIAAAFATALMAHAGEMPDFSDFDTDGDGVISSAEYVAHKTAKGTVTEEEALLKLSRVDLDGDTNISVEEFDSAIAAYKAKHKTKMQDDVAASTSDAQ